MKIVLFGAGNVGLALAQIFCQDEDVRALLVCDRRGNALAELEEKVNSSKIRTYKIGAEQETALKGIIRGADFFVNALPFRYNIKLTELAIKCGLNYLDLGGSSQILENQNVFNENAIEKKVYVVPNCGFAPGMSNIVAKHAYNDFESVDSIEIQSGVLPQDPKSPFNFQLVFSAEALLNEYFEDQLAVQNGKLSVIPSLDGLSTTSIASKPELGEFEAFYTADKITSFAKNMEGKLNSLTYKTIRYKGHNEVIRALAQLGLNSNQIMDVRSSVTYRKLLTRLVQQNLSGNEADYSILKVIVKGVQNGETVTKNYESYCDFDKELELSSLLKMSAFSTLIMAKLLHKQSVKENYGVHTPEQLIDSNAFIQELEKKGIDVKIS